MRNKATNELNICAKKIVNMNIKHNKQQKTLLEFLEVDKVQLTNKNSCLKNYKKFLDYTLSFQNP